jgi:hypothetical protein
MSLCFVVDASNQNVSRYSKRLVSTMATPSLSPSSLTRFSAPAMQFLTELGMHVSRTEGSFLRE